MKNDILLRYYKGILGQLSSEVQIINKIFEHNGLKGYGNEAVLSNLLEKFIPKKYGIGSGIVIDRHGNQSRQCDIVIYDNYHYPELLSMSNSKIFPIDLVHAVIEVKTSLNSSKSRLAVENIESVLNLDYVKESFRISPSEPIGELNENTILFQDHVTKPPLGYIFSYETTTNNFGTFLNWFIKDGNYLKKERPNHVCALDQGIVSFKNETKRPVPLLFPLLENDEIVKIKGRENHKVGNNRIYKYYDSLYPSTKLGSRNILVDQGKMLLNFIMMLNTMLQRRHINPNLNLMKHYLSLELLASHIYQEGKLKRLEKA